MKRQVLPAKVCYNQDKSTLLFLTVQPLATHSGGPTGGAMNRIEDKGMVNEAAKYFKEEVLESMPDIPRKELCDMVDDYIYYQADDVSREEAHAVVDATCIQN
jgi:hypothetical protein